MNSSVVVWGPEALDARKRAIQELRRRRIETQSAEVSESVGRSAMHVAQYMHYAAPDIAMYVRAQCSSMIHDP